MRSHKSTKGDGMILLFSMCLTALIVSAAAANSHQISVQELEKEIAGSAGVVIVDVRTMDEYSTGRIPDAVAIPRGTLELTVTEKTPDRNARIVVYSKRGARSRLAAAVLRNLGYTKVLQLEGGFEAWAKAGKPIKNWYGVVKIDGFGETEKGRKSSSSINPAEKREGKDAKLMSLAEISKEAKAGAPIITVDELRAKLDRNEKLLLIDNRTEVEYKAGHIENAILIQRGILNWMIFAETKDPDTEIVVVCRHGSRSALSTKDLKRIGFKNVRNLEGGVLAWTKAGNPLYNLHGKIRVEKEEEKPFKASAYQSLATPIE